MKKKLAMLLLVTMLVSCLAGCGNGDAQESNTLSNEENKEETGEETDEESGAEEIAGEITYMTATPIYAKMNAEINAELQKVYPNLTVNIEHISDNYEAVLKTKMESNSAPDVFTWQGFYAMNDFVESGRVADLTNEGFEELVLPNFLESGKSGDKLYGIPTIMQSVGLLYNKDVFEQAGVTELPATVSELEEAVEKVKAIGVQPFSSGLKEQWVCYDLFWFAQSPVMEDMQAWYDSMNAGTGTFMHDKMGDMFSQFDMIYENSGDKPLSDDFAELAHQLAAGEAAMAIQGDWTYDETVKIDPDANLGMIGLPVDENPENAAILADSAEILFVSADSEKKDLAIAFIKWMLSKEGSEYLGSLTHAPSTSTAKPVIELNPFADSANTWINEGKKTASFAWNYWAPGIMDVIGKDMQEYFMGSMTLEEMVADLDAQWDKSLE